MTPIHSRLLRRLVLLVAATLAFALGTGEASAAGHAVVVTSPAHPGGGPRAATRVRAQASKQPAATTGRGSRSKQASAQLRGGKQSGPARRGTTPGRTTAGRASHPSTGGARR